MLELYTFATPNGRKASVMLEEVGLPYALKVIDLSKGDQKRPEFLAINPNGKIPAILDREGPGGQPLAVFESGAILIYLAEKTGQLLPADPAGRFGVLQWLMFQMGGVGPMLGQLNHFARLASEKVPYGIDRYTQETVRLLSVLERQLSGSEFLAGAYSIADVATYPWLQNLEAHFSELLEAAPNVARWLSTVGSRPAVQKGMRVPDL